MDLLLNPNIAYLMLAGGLMLSILALISPGTGILEVGAFALILLAGWEIYNLPVNFWALGVLVLGMVPFIISVRRPGRSVYLILSIAAIVLGSAFLFRSEPQGWQPAVHPVLTLLVSAFSAGYLWLAARKIIEADKIRPVHDLDVLIGMRGEAKTEIGRTGSVYVNGELWSAQSDQTIPVGAEVVILSREGLVLHVQPIPHNGNG